MNISNEPLYDKTNDLFFTSSEDSNQPGHPSSQISLSGIRRILVRKNITKTSPCNENPLTPYFDIVKLRFTGVYIFPYSLQNIDCGYSLEPSH